jgi:hypothetical protein
LRVACSRSQMRYLRYGRFSLEYRVHHLRSTACQRMRLKRDPIFRSFRVDYGSEFDEWLRRAKLAHRTSWIIQRPAEALAGFTIVKEETDDPYGRQGRVLLDIPTPA